MNDMKPLFKKRAPAWDTLLALLISAICIAAVSYYYLDPFWTEDGALTSLLEAVIPRFFIAVFLLVVTLQFSPEILSFRRIPLKNLLWCVPLLFVVLANFPFSALIGGTARITRIDLIGLFAVKCLLIGLGEELLFRGILFGFLNELFEKRKSPFLTVLLSSVLFALFHLVNLLDGAGILPVLQQIGYSFLIGAMLAVLLVQTENLWLCVILHALFDFGGLIVSDLGAGSPHDTVFWILTIVFGVICAVHVVITLVKRCKRHT